MAQYHEQLELISFIRENEEKFYRIAYSYVKEPETALDLVQDAVVLALQKYHTLRNHDCMKNWFYRILVNQCLGYLRREKRRQLFFKKSQQQVCAEQQDTERVEACTDLYAALDQLPPDMKTVIILRFFEDMKLEEISEVLKVSPNTVKSRLYRALRHLKVNLEVN